MSKKYGESHDNKSVLDKLGESDGTLTFNGNKIGFDCSTGENGKSAYEIAVDEGFIGSESQWLLSLKGDKGDSGSSGKDGIAGLSAYEVAVKNGFIGTESEWISSLKGDKGNTGEKGEPGITLEQINTAIQNAVLDSWEGSY